MNKQEKLAELNANRPPCVATLGQGRITDFDSEQQSVTVEFTSGDEHCHSGNVVQGGFIAGMLDNAMSIAVMIECDQKFTPATLELKVTFLKSGTQGKNIAKGWIVRMGRTIVFIEGELHNEKGELLAKASSTARLLSKP